jgi:hypothetical protein
VCARGVLAASSLHACELGRRGIDVRSGAGSCPRRCGRHALGVDRWLGWMSGQAASPWDYAEHKASVARVSLVGETERRGELRGA